MAIKMTLLEIVQSILNDMDSEEASSITDNNEAAQVASIVRDTFYNIIATRNIPEHSGLLKLTALSDTDYPSHFSYPDNLKKIDVVWYKDSEGDYKEVKWCAPLDFLNRTDGRGSNYTSVYDKQGGTELRIQNNKHPEFYTSFDDEYIVMDSYESTVDTTLQSSKVRAHGVLYPVFLIEDSYTPDLDPVYFPYFLAESKSTAMSILKGASDPKVEQATRRQKSYIQNDRYNTTRPVTWNTYGRHAARGYPK